MTKKQQEQLDRIERKLDDLLARPVVQPVVIPVSPGRDVQPWDAPRFPGYEITCLQNPQ